jgi:hypothetical protein
MLRGEASPILLTAGTANRLEFRLSLEFELSSAPDPTLAKRRGSWRLSLRFSVEADPATEGRGFEPQVPYCWMD